MEDAAAKRREARRRKILENSEDRMKRLLGRKEEPETDNAQGSDSGSSSSSVVRKLEDALQDESKRHSSQEDSISDTELPPPVPSEEENLPEAFETLTPEHVEESEPVYRRSPIRTDTSQEVQSHVQKSRSSSPVETTETSQSRSREEVQSGFQRSRSSSPAESTDGSTSAAQRERQQQQLHAFQRQRQLLCVAVGVLVRLAFIHQLGQAVVMSAIFPFVAFEIAVVAYQRSCCMDLGADVKGGLWLSTMVLSGVKPEVIETYKQAMGAVAAAMDDFTVFFFAFVITHLVTPIT